MYHQWAAPPHCNEHVGHERNNHRQFPYILAAVISLAFASLTSVCIAVYVSENAHSYRQRGTSWEERASRYAVVALQDDACLFSDLHVGVVSAVGNHEKRASLRDFLARQGWTPDGTIGAHAATDSATASGQIRARFRFYLGEPTSGAEVDAVRAEQRAHGDVVVLPGVSDVYDNLPNKTVAFFRHALLRERFTHLAKMDDDARVNLTALAGLFGDVCERHWGGVQVVAQVKRSARIPRPGQVGVVMGHVSVRAPPQRREEHRWRVTEEQFGDAYYPAYPQGNFYVSNRRFVAGFVGCFDSNPEWGIRLEDVNIGIYARLCPHMNVVLLHNEGFQGYRVEGADPDHKYISFHMERSLGV